MTNEELAERIQAGETKLLLQLWEQVQRLIRWKAKRVAAALEYRSDIDSDDLCQAGYLAMINAVNTYHAESGAFSSWLLLHLKTAFSEATNMRSSRQKREPLNGAVSLSTPLGDDWDSDTLADIVEDKSCMMDLDTIEDRLWRQQLHEALESVLAEIPAQQSEILRRRYYRGETMAKAAQELGTTPGEIHKQERKGLQALRRAPLAKIIRPFYEFDCYHGTGLGAFIHTGSSIQERYLEYQEEQADRERRNSSK